MFAGCQIKVECKHGRRQITTRGIEQTLLGWLQISKVITTGKCLRKKNWSNNLLMTWKMWWKKVQPKIQLSTATTGHQFVSITCHHHPNIHRITLKELIHSLIFFVIFLLMFQWSHLWVLQLALVRFNE